MSSGRRGGRGGSSRNNLQMLRGGVQKIFLLEGQRVSTLFNLGKLNAVSKIGTIFRLAKIFVATKMSQ